MEKSQTHPFPSIFRLVQGRKKIYTIHVGSTEKIILFHLSFSYFHSSQIMEITLFHLISFPSLSFYPNSLQPKPKWKENQFVLSEVEKCKRSNLWKKKWKGVVLKGMTEIFYSDMGMEV